MDTTEEAIEQILGKMQGYIDDDDVQAEVKTEATAALTALFKKGEVEARLSEVEEIESAALHSSSIAMIAHLEDNGQCPFLDGMKGLLKDHIATLQASLKEENTV